MRLFSARIWLLLVLAAAVAAVPLLGQSPSRDDEAHTIRGTVRDERGKPMAGVWVQAATRAEFMTSCAPDLARFAYTDFDGTFVLERVVDGENIVYFEAPNYTPTVGHQFGGSVAFATREFPPQLYRYLPEINDRPVRHYVSTMIDSTGRFELRDAREPGAHDEFAVHQAYLTTYAPSTTHLDAARKIQIPGSGTSRVDIVVRQGLVTSVQGTTNDGWGRAFRLSGERGCATALEGDDGDFMFMDIPLGSYMLSTTLAGPHGLSRTWQARGSVSVTAERRAWVLARNGAHINDLSLNEQAAGAIPARAGASILGRAVDAANRPLGGVRLQLRRLDQKGLPLTTSTAGDGAFAFRGVAHGVYHLDATSNAHGSVCYGQRSEHDLPVDVVVDSDRPLQTEPIVFSAGTISGVVMDDSGRPVRFATLSPPDREWVLTNERGQFRISHMPAGELTLLVDFWRDTDQGRRRFMFSRSVTVQPNVETKNIRLQATSTDQQQPEAAATTSPASERDSPTASLTFTAHSDSIYQSAARVDLVRLPDRKGDTLTHLLVDVGLPTGTARLNVRPGRYAIEAIKGTTSVTSVRSDNGDILDGTLELSAGDNEKLTLSATSGSVCCRIEGRVQDRNRVTTHATVVIFPTEEKWRGSRSRRIRIVRPRTDLRFVIDDLPAGSYYVVAIPMWTEEKPDAAFFERLAAHATTLTFTKERGQRGALALKVTSID